MSEGTNSIPFWKSTKKTLGVVGFLLYWGTQVIAILDDPTIVVSMAIMNVSLILGLLGIKAIGGAIQSNKTGDK